MKVFLWICAVVLGVALLISMLFLASCVNMGLYGNFGHPVPNEEHVARAQLMSICGATGSVWLGSIWGVLLVIVIQKLRKLKTGVVEEKVRFRGKKLVGVILLRVFVGVIVFVMFISVPILITGIIFAFGRAFEWYWTTPEQIAADRLWSMQMMFVAIGIYCVSTALLVLSKWGIKKLKRQNVE